MGYIDGQLDNLDRGNDVGQAMAPSPGDGPMAGGKHLAPRLSEGLVEVRGQDLRRHGMALGRPVTVL